ncbi:MAG: hypothetical protein PHX45_06850, partial [Acidobacteriota bacterium]|nr:hypothetical protein [Acidobacteriota bacterium]
PSARFTDLPPWMIFRIFTDPAMRLTMSASFFAGRFGAGGTPGFRSAFSRPAFPQEQKTRNRRI